LPDEPPEEIEFAYRFVKALTGGRPPEDERRAMTASSM